MPNEKNEYTQGWGTVSELKFLAKAGTFCEGRIQVPRPVILRGYRASMASRVNWGSIDKKKIDEYLKKEGY